jgi:FkbM family methyltransferase
MNLVERSARWLKYRLGFNDESGFVVAVRPHFNKFMEILYERRGLARKVEGQEPIRIRPAYRNFNDDFECSVSRYLGQVIKPGDIILEIGAHIGVFTIRLARWAGSAGHVYAFEPCPASLRALSDHLAFNGVSDRVSIVPAAVSDVAGRAAFYFDGTSGENTLSPRHGRLPFAHPIEVEVITIDDFCSERAIIPSFIKIDIEGYELHALRGAARTVRRCHPAILLEMHPFNWPEIGVTPADAAELFATLGYNATPLDGDGAPFTSYCHIVLEPTHKP